jgi:hypothetical protein
MEKILAVRSKGLFWAGNEMGRSFFLWTLGWAFGSFTLYSILWKLHTILNSLDSQQSLTIQSHGLSTWTAVV